MIVTQPLIRPWGKLAPKLLAFLASGAALVLFTSTVQAFGIPLAPEPVAIIGGAATAFFAWLKRDRVLGLPPQLLAPKVVAFVCSGITASAIVALAPYLGYSHLIDGPRAAVIVTVLGLIAGYATEDVTLEDDDTPGRHAAA